jgi:hypothetical protein
MRSILPLLLLTACWQPADEACGELTVPLMAGQHYEAGSITVSNDAENLVVVYETTGDWVITETHLHVGCDVWDIPMNRGGNPQVGHFDYQGEHDPAVTTVTYTVPLADIECFEACGQDLVIAAHASVERPDGSGGTQGETAWGDGPGFPGHNWAMYFEYEVACCEDDSGEPEEPCNDPGDHRTQTMGGWGATANGGNPGVYRDANFDACIGTLVLGSPLGHTLTLSSAAAVEAFLPQGSTAGPLTADEVDPTVSSAGVLAGQLTALGLSLAFDACDPDFGASELPLADTIAQWGTCEGLSAQAIYDAGNCAISGAMHCAYSAAEINECLTDANEAFVDGEDVSGYLCD